MPHSTHSPEKAWRRTHRRFYSLPTKAQLHLPSLPSLPSNVEPVLSAPLSSSEQTKKARNWTFFVAREHAPYLRLSALGPANSSGCNTHPQKKAWPTQGGPGFCVSQQHPGKPECCGKRLFSNGHGHRRSHHHCRRRSRRRCYHGNRRHCRHGNRRRFLHGDEQRSPSGYGRPAVARSGR